MGVKNLWGVLSSTGQLIAVGSPGDAVKGSPSATHRSASTVAAEISNVVNAATTGSSVKCSTSEEQKLNNLVNNAENNPVNLENALSKLNLDSKDDEEQSMEAGNANTGAGLSNHELGQSFSGQAVAVDLSCWVCDSQANSNMHAVIKPHLRNLLFRTWSLLSVGVLPVFVVEGDAPELKHATMRARNAQRTGRAAKPGTKPATRKRFNSVLKQCCELFQLLGVPWVQADGEAEATCAALVYHKVVAGVITEDSDVFLYGGDSVLRSFSVQANRPTAELYTVSQLEQKLRLSRPGLVMLSLLLGCDYLPAGVPGVGVSSAVKLVTSWGIRNINPFDRLKSWAAMPVDANASVAKFRKNGDLDDLERAVRDRAVRTPGFPFTDVVEEFTRTLQLTGLSKDRFCWGQPRYKELLVWCCRQLGWEENYAAEKAAQFCARWVTCYAPPPSHALLQTMQVGRIVKSCTRGGVASYLVEWSVAGNRSSGGDAVGVGGRDVIITTEPQQLFNTAAAAVVEQYELETAAKKKGKSKKKDKTPMGSDAINRRKVSKKSTKESQGDPKQLKLTAFVNSACHSSSLDVVRSPRNDTDCRNSNAKKQIRKSRKNTEISSNVEEDINSMGSSGTRFQNYIQKNDACEIHEEKGYYSRVSSLVQPKNRSIQNYNSEVIHDERSKSGGSVRYKPGISNKENVVPEIIELCDSDDSSDQEGIYAPKKSTKITNKHEKYSINAKNNLKKADPIVKANYSGGYREIIGKPESTTKENSFSCDVDICSDLDLNSDTFDFGCEDSENFSNDDMSFIVDRFINMNVNRQKTSSKNKNKDDCFKSRGSSLTKEVTNSSNLQKLGINKEERKAIKNKTKYDRNQMIPSTVINDAENTEKTSRNVQLNLLDQERSNTRHNSRDTDEEIVAPFSLMERAKLKMNKEKSSKNLTDDNEAAAKSEECVQEGGNHPLKQIEFTDVTSARTHINDECNGKHATNYLAYSADCSSFMLGHFKREDLGYDDDSNKKCDLPSHVCNEIIRKYSNNDSSVSDNLNHDFTRSKDLDTMHGKEKNFVTRCVSKESSDFEQYEKFSFESDQGSSLVAEARAKEMKCSTSCDASESQKGTPNAETFPSKTFEVKSLLPEKTLNHYQITSGGCNPTEPRSGNESNLTEPEPGSRANRTESKAGNGSFDLFDDSLLSDQEDPTSDETDLTKISCIWSKAEDMIKPVVNVVLTEISIGEKNDEISSDVNVCDARYSKCSQSSTPSQKSDASKKVNQSNEDLGSIDQPLVSNQHEKPCFSLLDSFWLESESFLCSPVTSTADRTPDSDGDSSPVRVSKLRTKNISSPIASKMQANNTESSPISGITKVPRIANFSSIHSSPVSVDRYSCSVVDNLKTNNLEPNDNIPCMDLKEPSNNTKNNSEGLLAITPNKDIIGSVFENRHDADILMQIYKNNSEGLLAITPNKDIIGSVFENRHDADIQRKPVSPQADMIAMCNVIPSSSSNGDTLSLLPSPSSAVIVDPSSPGSVDKSPSVSSADRASSTPLPLTLSTSFLLSPCLQQPSLAERMKRKYGKKTVSSLLPHTN